MAFIIKDRNVQVGVHQVVIAQDDETGEYRCRLISNRVPHPPADYFTDDKDDARHTAWAMARHAAGTHEMARNTR